jgi:hypothetical protein
MAIKIVYLKDLKAIEADKARKQKSGPIKAVAKDRHSGQLLAKGKVSRSEIRGSAKESNGTVRAKGSDSLGVKVVVDSGGQRHRLRILDARSDTFGEDFEYAFSRNVKKARKENTRVIGQPDVAVKQ